MWYFTWMLGVGFAVMLAILNAMWLESHHHSSPCEDA